MDRITINLTSDDGVKLRQAAAADSRSLSDYVRLIVLREIEHGGATVGPELAAAIAEARLLNLDLIALIRREIATLDCEDTRTAEAQARENSET